MASVRLTAREMEILIAFVKEAKNDVDWNKVAAASNCNTAKYARDKFWQIKNKITTSMGNQGSAVADGGTPKGTPKSTPQKPKVTPQKRGYADVDDEEALPRKQKTPRGKTPAALKDEAAEEIKPKTEKDSDDELEMWTA